MSADFCIVMPAYKAEKVLAATVARLPTDLAERKGVLLVIDDASPDGTGRVADELASTHPWIEVIHHEQNRGYGGAQKTGLREGLRRGCRGFAIVHADGQYAPEQVLDLLAPILSGEADLVQGSRLLADGGARAGGMPLFRYLANRGLTAMENLAFGTHLAEFHSGYMLYSRRLLEALPFASLQDNFNFDAEIILLAHLAGFPCRELAIPTHYGEESSSLDPIPYGVNVLKMIGRHWLGHYDRLLREAPRSAANLPRSGPCRMSDLPKVLLLGAGGFIGANLTERLLADGRHEVTAIDVDGEKLEGQLGHARLTFRQHDIRQRDDALDSLVQDHDLVVDLVAMANPSLYLTNPLDVFHLNFTENLRIVEHCVKHRKRIVQFSTCEVYGRTVAGVLGKDPGEMPFPFHEDNSPLIMGPVKNHRWIYACAKQLLERVLHAHGLEDGLNYTIIRPFNFIGPRIDYLPSEKAGNPRVFSHFMNALLYGTPMKLVDGGRNYRAYTHIDDAVEGIVRILDNPGGVCDREIFNLGTPENETTIRGLAVRMRGIFDEHFRRPGDPDPEIIEVSGEEFYGKGYEDCDRRIPDVTKARTLLGWESHHDLDSVIYHTMKYFVDAHRAKTGSPHE